MAKHDLILQTKLMPPQVKGKILRRERLLNLFKNNLEKKLILIYADAGYGKTTLLAQFCAEFDKPYMFYDLDASDNDLATFFNYITSGIQKHYPDFGQKTKSIISQTRNIEILVGTFINEFVERSPHPSPYTSSGQALPRREGGIKGGEDFYIILDDYHHLQQNKEINNALDYLLHHLPLNLHLIISSRSTPPLNLAYYFAKQELFKLEKEHLQFNLKEIQLLLKEVYGLNIPAVEIERIEKHSEGWITAIQLILQKISASGEEKAKETLNGYVASGEEVFNYFASEVFESQPEKIREFLIKTSILELLNKEICDNILKIKDAEQILSYLETEHIFITKSSTNSYKYHPLFKKFLYKNLKVSYSEEKIRLFHRKAGRYFTGTKEYSPAIDHFFHAEDYEMAGKVLEKYCPTIISSGKVHTFINLVNYLPVSVLNKHPYLLLEKSKIFAFLGKWEEALKFSIKAERAFSKKKNLKGKAEVLSRRGFIYLVLMQPHRAFSLEKRAYKLLGVHNPALKASTLSIMGSINRDLGKFIEAENCLKEAIALAHKCGKDRIEAQAINGLAGLYSTTCDFRKAIETESVLLTKYKTEIPPLWFAGVYSDVASYYTELGEYKKAKEFLDKSVEIALQFNDKRGIAYSTGVRGKLHFYKGSYKQAIDCYENAIKLNKELKEKLLDLYALIDVTAVYLMMNDVVKAKSELKKIEDIISPKIRIPIFIDYLLLKGKIGIADEDFFSAKKNLFQALKTSEKFCLTYQKMMILYYLSGLYVKNANYTLAIKYLRKSLYIAEKNRYDFFLIREGRNNLQILEYALRHNISDKYLLPIISEVGTNEAVDLLKKRREEDYDLEIRLFKNLEIKDAQGKILEPNWKTMKTKSLFIFLCVNQGERFSLDQLIETFWSDKGLIEGKQSLHTQISFLRHILRRMIKRKFQQKDLIVYKYKTYHLNPNLYLKIDVLEFDQKRKEATRLESIDKLKAVHLYQQVLELYRGDLCPDLYESWVEDKKLFYRKSAVKIAQDLGRFFYEDEDYPKSLDFYEKALVFDRCDEKSHIGIMQVQAARGDKQGVKNQYQLLKDILAKELNSLPTPETTVIYQRILQQPS